MAIKNVFADTIALKERIKNMSVDELQACMSSVESGETLLVDLREIQEVVDLGTIPGAKHVARGMLEFSADPSSPYYRKYFQEDAKIVVFCAGGGRSVYATLALEEMGFKDVAHLEVGFNGWKKAGGAVEDVMVSPTSTAVTIASAAADTYTYFQVARNATNVADDFTGDVRLLGIKLFYTTDAANDA